MTFHLCANANRHWISPLSTALYDRAQGSKRTSLLRILFPSFRWCQWSLSDAGCDGEIRRYYWRRHSSFQTPIWFLSTYSYFTCSRIYEHCMRQSVTARARIFPLYSVSYHLTPTTRPGRFPNLSKRSLSPSVLTHPFSQPLPTMADDTSYATFLTTANQSLNATSSLSQPTSGAKSKFDPTTPQTSAVPPALQNLGGATYTSDADEPFEVIVLDYAGHELPDATAICELCEEGGG